MEMNRTHEAHGASRSRLEVLARHLVLDGGRRGDLEPVGVKAEDSAARDPKASLAKERREAEQRFGFGKKEIRRMTHLLNGDEEFTKAKELASLIIERDPELRIDRPFDMTLKEAREKCIRQIRRAVEVRAQLKKKSSTPTPATSPDGSWEGGLLELAFAWTMGVYSPSFQFRMYVHEFLFGNTLELLGSDEQWQRYKDDVKTLRMYGCFAMTELGHSSFLRGAETTATYDPETKEFVINTPTLTATKWWIGAAGQTATHTVALCQLIIHGQNHGLQWFLVPLRDPRDGSLLPTIAAGDVGAKMGRPGVDNGWIQFNNTRIPLENMLCRYAKVLPDGTFESPANPALAYMTLISERLGSLGMAFDSVAQAVTISTRYAAARRQGPKDQQILDYQSQYVWLTQIIAGAYVLNFAQKDLLNRWAKIRSHQNDEDLSEFLNGLASIHAVSAGVKCWVGWWTSDSLERVRRAMGGHAYSAYNNIPSIIADWGVMTTGGGDNVVLAQQHARYLLSLFQGDPSGWLRQISDFTLPPSPKFHARDLREAEKELTLLKVLEALFFLLSHVVETSAKALEEIANSSSSEAWNEQMMQLLVPSRIHTSFYLIYQFATMLESVSEAPHRDILTKIGLLHGLVLLEQEMKLLLVHGYVTPQQTSWIQSISLKLSKELRALAVPLVDAFNFSDFLIKAPVGRYDGDVYEAYFDVVKNLPKETIGDPWPKYIKPLTNPTQTL